METECCCQKNSNSGFVFGLICGAVIGAIIAVVIYKNNKTEVFENLEKKIKNFFSDLIPSENPLPKKIISSTTSPPRSKKPTPKMFVKPRK